jgi:CDP-diacylglycerol---glycerol-3-phosphate 3-phosphatidyltransferase
MTATVSTAPTVRPSPVSVTGFWPRVPNALTLLRVLLAVAFFLALTPWDQAPNHIRSLPSSGRLPGLTLVLAASLFIVAALTDALDGYLARRWNAVTKFGRVMDPFADKILVIGAFVYLAGPAFLAKTDTDVIIQTTGVEPWMVVLIMGRELLVTSIRAVLESEGTSFGSSWSGKAKMILQSVVIPVILGALAFLDVAPGKPGRWLIDASVYATVLVTVASVWPYLARAVVSMKDPGSTPPRPPTS